MGNAGIRHPVIQWLPFAMILCLPAVALAQVSVQYQTLTLVESAYLYSGLALQSILRLSSLRQLPQAIVACGVVWLLYRRLTTSHPQPLAGIVAYVISCSVILVLFWPEAAPRFFSPLTTRVFPGAVTSYVAQRNVMAVDNAGASRLVPASLQTAGGAPVPRFTDLLLARRHHGAPHPRRDHRLAGPGASLRENPGVARTHETGRAARPDRHDARVRKPLLQPGRRPGCGRPRPCFRDGGTLGFHHVHRAGEADPADRKGPRPDPEEVAAGPVLRPHRQLQVVL